MAMYPWTDPDPDDPSINYPTPTVPNTGPILSPESSLHPSYPVMDPREPLRLPPAYPDPNRPPSGIELGPPSDYSQYTNPETLYSSTTQRQPGDPTLQEAAWGEHTAAMHRGVKGRLKHGAEMMMLGGLGGEVPSPRYALGRMAGSFLTGLVYPKAADVAYQERVARPRQQQEIADATAKREREYQAQKEQQEAAIRQAQIDTYNTNKAAAEWIIVSPAGGTPGQDGKLYQVLRNIKTNDEQWLRLPDPEEKLHNVPADTTVLGAGNRVVYQSGPKAGAAGAQKPAMADTAARQMAEAQILNEYHVGSREEWANQWKAGRPNAVKDYIDTVSGPGSFDNLRKRAAAGKTADARAAAKTLQDAEIEVTKRVHAEANSALDREVNARIQKFMFPQGLPGQAAQEPTGIAGAKPIGPAPPPQQRPPGTGGSPAQSGVLNQQQFTERYNQLTGQGLTPQQAIDQISKESLQ